MPADVYSLAPCRMGSTVLPVESVGLSLGILNNLHQHSGNEFPTLITVPGANPRVTLTIPFYDAYAVLGLAPVELSTFDLYMAKYVTLIKSSSSVHTKFALSSSCKAAAMITGATVNQDGILMATVEVVPLSNNGTAYQLTKTDNNSLPALSAQPTLHSLGPVSINGTVQPGLQSASIDLGQSFDVQRTDGALYPIVANRIDARPRASGVHADPIGMLNRLGSLLGANITSNVVLYFRQYSATGGIIDTGSTAISVTIAIGRATPLDVTNAQGQVSTIGVDFHGLSTSSTNPLAISTSATAPAIP